MRKMFQGVSETLEFVSGNKEALSPRIHPWEGFRLKRAYSLREQWSQIKIMRLK